MTLPATDTRLKTALYRIGLTAAILLFTGWGFQARLGHEEDWVAGLWSHIKNLKPAPFLLAIIIYHLSQTLGAYRMQVITGALGLNVPYGKLLRNLYIGLLFNPLLMGATGGDVVRSYYLARETGKKAEIVTVVFLDRFVGIAVLVLIALIALLANLGDPQFKVLILPLSLFFLFLITIAALSSSRRVKDRLGFLKNWMGESRLRRIGRASFEILNRSKHQTAMLFKAAGITILYQSLMILSVWLTASALHQVEPVSLKHFFLFMPIIFTVTAIPISLGGLGVGEALYAACFSMVGVVETEAIAIALLNRLVLILAAVVGGIVYFCSSAEPYRNTSPE